MAEGRQPYHSGDVALYESLRQPILARLRQDLQGTPDTCSVCAQLCECVAECDAEVRIRYHFRLGLDDILALDCAGHRPFFEKLREPLAAKIRYFYHGAEDEVRRRVAAEVSTALLGVELRDGALYVGRGNLGRRVKLELARRDGIPDHPGRWTPVRSPRVDLDLVRAWRRRCAAVHGDACANPWQIPPVTPQWLVDAERRCLVPGDEAADAAYVCLSYRRGPAATAFGATLASLPGLRQPGALDAPDVASRLPRVVADAIHLVRGLGERYLWVDALCLAADDAAAEAAEVARIGHLYAGAALTIVAAEDDADAGLPGVSEAAPARLTSQMLLPLGGERLMIVSPGLSSDATDGTAYAGHAWTFQEYELSGCRLVFAGQRVHWACAREHRDEWARRRHECADAACPQHNPSGARPSPRSLTVAGLPDPRAYDRLVRRYNGRAIARDADAPRAVAGLLAVLTRGFPGGFLWGLPIMFVDAALGWRPAVGGRGETGEVARRAGADLPSWSWLGWRGPVRCCDDEDGFVSYDVDTAYQTHAITTWYSARGPPLARLDDPLPSWFPHRAAHCDPDAPLPPGWRAQSLDAPTEKRPFGFDRPPAGCSRSIFAHASLPGEYFWYHFSLPAGPDEPPPTPHLPQPAYLCAATARLRLVVYRDAALARGSVAGLRRVGDGDRVGHLWLHSASDLEALPAEGAPVDLVAVCRRVSSAETPKPWEAAQFYAEHYVVLWVEWRGGVAYRRASGVVERGAWDAHPDREAVDLVLG